MVSRKPHKLRAPKGPTFGAGLRGRYRLACRCGWGTTRHFDGGDAADERAALEELAEAGDLHLAVVAAVPRLDTLAAAGELAGGRRITELAELAGAPFAGRRGKARECVTLAEHLAAAGWEQRGNRRLWFAPPGRP